MNDSALEAFREGGMNLNQNSFNNSFEGIGSFLEKENGRKTGGSSFFGSMVATEPIIEEEASINSSPV